MVILCQSPDNVTDIKLQLESKGYRVAVEISVTNFMIHIEQNKPGFVLISKSLKSGMALQLPTFLQKKFKVPVMMFTERSVNAHLNEHINSGENQPEEKSSTSQSISVTSKHKEPEILNMQSEAAEDVVDKLSNFEEDYKKQFWSASPAEVKIADKAISTIQDNILKTKDVAWNDEKELELHSLKVKDPSGEGYFIVALPEVPEAEKEKLIADLEAQVQEHLGIEAHIEKLTNKVKFKQYKKITENSSKVLKGMFGEQEIILAFTQEIPEADLTAVQVMEDAFMVPIEVWWTEIPLNFRVYHYMPVNNKRLLYVKPGRMLQPETLDRFSRKGVKKMLIPAEEIDAYRRLQELALVSRASSSASKALVEESPKSSLSALEMFALLEDEDDNEGSTP